MHPPIVMLSPRCLRCKVICYTITLSEYMWHYHTNLFRSSNSAQPSITDMLGDLPYSVITKIDDIHRIRFHPHVWPIEFGSLFNCNNKRHHLSNKSKLVTNPYRETTFGESMASPENATATCQSRRIVSSAINVAFNLPFRQKIPHNFLDRRRGRVVALNSESLNNYPIIHIVLNWSSI